MPAEVADYGKFGDLVSPSPAPEPNDFGKFADLAAADSAQAVSTTTTEDFGKFADLAAADQTAPASTAAANDDPVASTDYGKFADLVPPSPSETALSDVQQTAVKPNEQNVDPALVQWLNDSGVTDPKERALFTEPPTRGAGERPPFGMNIAQGLDAIGRMVGVETGFGKLEESGTYVPEPGEPSFENLGISQIPEQQGKVGQTAAALGNVGIGFANFALSGGGAATIKGIGMMPKFLRVLTGMGFTAQQIKQFFEAKTYQEKVTSAVGAALLGAGTAVDATIKTKGKTNAIQEPSAASKVPQTSGAGQNVPSDAGQVGVGDTGGQTAGAVAPEVVAAAEETPTLAQPIGVTETLAELNRRNGRAAELPTPENKGLGLPIPSEQSAREMAKRIVEESEPTPSELAQMEKESQAEAMAAYHEQQGQSSDEILELVAKYGGLQSPGHPERVARIKSAKTKGATLTKDELDTVYSEAKVAVEEGRLTRKEFRKLFRPSKTKPLMLVREAAEEAGFPFETEGDMLGALRERFASGRKQYGTMRVSEEEREVFGFGPGAAAGGEFPERESISIKNAAIDEARTNRGLEPLMSAARQADPVTWDKAMATIESDPNAGIKLVDAINKGEKKATTNVEQMMLLHEDIRLRNEREMEAQRANDAHLSQTEREIHATNFDLLESRLHTVEEASRTSGSVLGSALRIRQLAAFDDYTLAAIETRARNAKGDVLSRAEHDELASAHAKIEELRKQLEVASDTTAREQAMSALDDLIRENLAEAKAATKGGKSVLDVIHNQRDAARQRIIARRGTLKVTVDPLNVAGLVDEAIIGASHVADGLVELGAWSKKMVEEFGDRIKPYLDALFEKSKTLYHALNDVAKEKRGLSAIQKVEEASKRGKGLSQKVIFDLAREHVRAGTTDLDAVMEAVRKDLEPYFPDATVRQVRDVFSDYGKRRVPSKEEDLVKMRELRRLAQLASSLEDVRQKIEPKKSGQQRDKPSEEIRRKTRELKEEMRRAGIETTSPEQHLASTNQARLTSLTNQIEDLEREIKTGERPPVSGGSPVPETPEVVTAKQRRDELKKEVDQLRAESPEYQAEVAKADLARYKSAIKTRIKTVERRLAERDYAPRQKKERVMDKETQDIRFEYSKAKQKLDRRIFQWKLDQRTGTRKTIDSVRDVLNTARSIKTSIDLSAPGRQGLFVVASHPIMAAKSLIPMVRAFASEKAHFKVFDEIQHRENAPLYEKAKLYISDIHDTRLSKLEEVYMSRWADKIPLVAGSQRAYVTFLNKLRADAFDTLAHQLSRRGSPKDLTTEQLRAIGNYVNVATGRGEMGAHAVAAVTLNTAFFAPRFVLSRFQLLAGQPFYQGTTGTRLLFAKEYARAIAGVGTVFALGLMAGGTVETDPRSTDFGKLRFGNTTVDPMGGLAQSIVFGSRVVSGTTKTQTGNIVPLRGEGVPYAGSTTGDVILRFVRSKLSPAAGAGFDLAEGKDYTGQPVTPLSELSNMVMPMNPNDVYKAMVSEGIPVGTAIGLLSTLGFSVNSYERKPSKGKEPSKIPVAY